MNTNATTETFDSKPPSNAAPLVACVRLPAELEHFTQEQLEAVHDRLRSSTYAEVQQAILSDTGVRISINKLFRYYHRLELAEQQETAQDTADPISELLDVYQTLNLDLATAGLETIKRRALQLAASPTTKPSLLLALMKIFTWEDRKSWDLNRCAYSNRMAAVAERRVARRQNQVKFQRENSRISRAEPNFLTTPDKNVAQPESSLAHAPTPVQ